MLYKKELDRQLTPLWIEMNRPHWRDGIYGWKAAKYANKKKYRENFKHYLDALEELGYTIDK